MSNTISKFKLTIACKAVRDQRKILVAFHIAGAFEEFIQYAADNNSRRRDKARHWNLVGQVAIN